MVDIADLFNQCYQLPMLTLCDPTSPCGKAAKQLEVQMSSLGFTSTAAAAQQCVNVYVASLGTNEAPSADVLTYVLSKINTAGATLCVPTTSGVFAIVPSLSIILALLFA